MSEEERRQRLGYRKIRKKRITAGTVILIALLVLTLAASVLTVMLNNTYYVNYSETSKVDWGVHLKENEFYEESFLGKDYAYIASLIDKVEARFDYGMTVESEKAVDFDYTYRVDAVVEIRDIYSGKLLYAPVYNEIAEVEKAVSGTRVDVGQTVIVDYAKYNAIAERFMDVYNLESAKASLVLKMSVGVKGVSDEFHGNESSNSYVSSISVPLSADTVEVKITSALPKADQKILSYTTEDTADQFRSVSWILAVLSILTFAVLVSYTYLSRNIDVTHEIRVKRILSSYRSFIQILRNEFNTAGYQLLQLSSFNEMLEIRDTIDSPILMYENIDKTCATFLIPTSTNLLYVFELKVDDYDDLYGNGTNPPEDPEPTPPDFDDGYDIVSDEYVPPVVVDEPVIEPVEESEPAAEPVADEAEAEPVAEEAEAEPEAAPVAVIVEEPVIEVVLEPETEAEPVEEIVEPEPEAEPVEEIVEPEVVAEPEPVAEPENNIPLDHLVEIDDGGEGTAIAYIDESGNVISIACSRSFTANLIQSNPQVKSYYNELKNHILSYKGVKARMSWRLESFNKGRTQLFKLKIRGKTICMYCALNPDDFDEAKYFHERATAKNYAAVPMMVRIKSDRGLKRAKALVDMVMAAFSIPALARFESVDYAADYPYDTTKSLVERKLIKLLLPDAVAAEPKPHHHVHKKTVEVVHDDVVEEITIFEADDVQQEALEELIEAPTPALDEIDFDDASEEIPDFEETPEHPGVDVIGVVWPEKPKRNKIYRYDPDGESVSVGDIVIVPTRDAHKNREVIRKAAVAHANHKINPETLSFPLKKILGVLNKKTKSEESSDVD